MKSHSLGMGAGAIREYEDGTAEFWPWMNLKPAFKVRIADITGFTETRAEKFTKTVFAIQGNGTQLASVVLMPGLPDKIEAWFRKHPNFRGNGSAAPAVASAASGIADELSKLADLHRTGVLTDDEFSALKAKLLA